MTTKEELIAKRNQTREELDRIERELAERNALTPEQELATELHEMLCNWDHMTGCYWNLEKHWDSSARQRWMNKAERISALSDPETALQIVKIAREF